MKYFFTLRKIKTGFMVLNLSSLKIWKKLIGIKGKSRRREGKETAGFGKFT